MVWLVGWFGLVSLIGWLVGWSGLVWFDLVWLAWLVGFWSGPGQVFFPLVGWSIGWSGSWYHGHWLRFCQRLVVGHF